MGGVAMLQNWDDWVNPRFQVKQRARAIEAILRKEKCTALVACSGDLLDPPAGFLAAQADGGAIYSYMFDDYEHQWTVPSVRRFGIGVCRQVIGQAAGVIVPNEFLANVYRQAYGIESVIVAQSLWRRFQHFPRRRRPTDHSASFTPERSTKRTSTPSFA